MILVLSYEDAVHRLNHPDMENSVAATLPSFSDHDGALATVKYWRERLRRYQPATNIVLDECSKAPVIVGDVSLERPLYHAAAVVLVLSVAGDLPDRT